MQLWNVHSQATLQIFCYKTIKIYLIIYNKNKIKPEIIPNLSSKYYKTLQFTRTKDSNNQIRFQFKYYIINNKRTTNLKIYSTVLTWDVTRSSAILGGIPKSNIKSWFAGWDACSYIPKHQAQKKNGTKNMKTTMQNFKQKPQNKLKTIIQKQCNSTILHLQARTRLDLAFASLHRKYEWLKCTTRIIGGTCFNWIC